MSSSISYASPQIHPFWQTGASLMHSWKRCWEKDFSSLSIFSWFSLDVHPSWDYNVSNPSHTFDHKFFFYALMFIPRGTMVPNSLIHSDSRTWGQSNVLRIRVGWLCAICANFVVEILKSWFYHVFFCVAICDFGSILKCFISVLRSSLNIWFHFSI